MAESKFWEEFDKPLAQPVAASSMWDEFDKAQPKESGDTWRGVTTAAKQLPQLGYGALAGIGAVGESAFGEGGLSTDLKKYGVEKYQAAGQDIAKDAKESDSLTYSWDQAKQGNYGAMVDWLQYGIGYGGVQALEALASGGIGAAVGKATLKGTAEHLASGMVAKETARIAATAEGATLAADAVSKMAVANVASKIGQLAGIGAQAFGMEGGEIGGGLAEESVKRGTPLTGEEIAKGLGATLAAGGLEFVGDKFGVDVMLGKSGIFKPAAGMAGLGGKVARGGIAAAGAIPLEAGTEYLQTGLEEYGQGKEANILPWNQSEEAQRQAFDAAGLGGLGGGVMAAGGGLLSQPIEPQQKPKPTPEDILAAPDVDAAIQTFTDSLDSTDLPDEITARTAPEAAAPITTPEASPSYTNPIQEAQNGAILSGTPEISQADLRPTGTAADVLPGQPEDVRGNATAGNGVNLVGGGVATQGAQPTGGVSVSPVSPVVGRGAEAVGAGLDKNALQASKISDTEQQATSEMTRYNTPAVSNTITSDSSQPTVNSGLASTLPSEATSTPQSTPQTLAPAGVSTSAPNISETLKPLAAKLASTKAPDETRAKMVFNAAKVAASNMAQGKETPDAAKFKKHADNLGKMFDGKYASEAAQIMAVHDAIIAAQPAVTVTPTPNKPKAEATPEDARIREEAKQLGIGSHAFGKIDVLANVIASKKIAAAQSAYEAVQARANELIDSNALADIEEAAIKQYGAHDASAISFKQHADALEQAITNHKPSEVKDEGTQGNAGATAAGAAEEGYPQHGAEDGDEGAAQGEVANPNKATYSTFQDGRMIRVAASGVPPAMFGSKFEAQAKEYHEGLKAAADPVVFAKEWSDKVKADSQIAKPAPEAAAGNVKPFSDVRPYLVGNVFGKEKGEEVPDARFAVGTLPADTIAEIGQFIDGFSDKFALVRISGRTLKHTDEQRHAELDSVIDSLPQIIEGKAEVLHNPTRDDSALVVYERDKNYLVVLEVAKNGNGTDVVNIITTRDRGLKQYRKKSADWLDGRRSHHPVNPEVPAEGEISAFQPIGDENIPQPTAEIKPAQEQRATAILDRANVTGKDRLDIMADFRAGKHSLEDLEAAYPAKSKTATDHILEDAQNLKEEVVFNSVSDNPERWKHNSDEWKRVDHKTFNKVGAVKGYDIYHKKSDTDEGYIKVVTHDGNVIGNTFYARGDNGNLEGAIEVSPGYRRQGIATGMYNQIEKITGEKLHPAEKHTPYAEAFWKSRKAAQAEQPVSGESAVIRNTQPGDAIPESEWLSVSLLEEETSKLLEPFATEIPVLIRDTARDAGIESADDGVTSGAVYNGRIHLFRDGLSDRAAVVRTLWHELLHFGFRRFMTEEQYIAKMGELYMKDGWIRNRANAWMQTAEAKKLAETKKHGYVRARAVDEALADLAEIMQTEPTGYQNNTKLAQAKRIISEWIAKLADFFGFKEAAQAWREYAAQKDARDLIVATFAKLREGAPPSMLNAKWHYSDPAFMVAWHGSPHDHDKFDSAKIGTGEGAQAYGHGLYFAGNKEVAEWYRDNLADYDNVFVFNDGSKITIDDTGYVESKDKEGNVFDAIASGDNVTIAASVLLDDSVEDIDSLKDRIEEEDYTSGGRLYQVELYPSEDEYLLWDKPLSEQSEKVKAALEKTALSGTKSPWKQTGEQLYHSMARGDIGWDTNSDKAASEYLHSLGIRGIKYLDGSSRNNGEGSHNYVIFNDEDVTILAKASRASKSAPNATPQTIESVKQATKALRNRWLGFRKIEIVQHDSDLPQEFTDRLLRSGGELTGSEGWFDQKTKTVYLVADNLASPERAVWVAIHETVGHGGIRMLGKSVADALEFAGKNGYVKKLAQAIAADRGETFDARTHTDEAIAELAAATITGNVDAIMERYGVKVPMGMRSNLLGMVKRVVDAVRQFIGRVTGKPVEAVSDGEVLGLIRQMKEAVEGVAKGYDTAGVSNGVMASLPSAKDAFVSALGRWFSMPEKIRGSGLPLVVGKTPSTLLKVGAEQHPIQIDRGTLIKLVRQHSRVEPKGHGLTKERIEKIPEQIADPIAIFESAPDPKTGKRRNDGRVVLTSLVDSQGEQVIVAIHLSKQVGRGNVINDVSSMHGREDKEIKSWVDAGLTLYFNDTRNETSPEWLTTGRLELPAVVQAAQSLGNKVLLKSEIVKDTDAPLFSSAPKQQSIPGTAQQPRPIVESLAQEHGRPMGELLNMFDRNQIVQMYEKSLPELRDYKHEQEAIVADRNKAMYEADGFLDKLRAVPMALRDKFSTLAHEATIAGIDPSEEYQDNDQTKELRRMESILDERAKEGALPDSQKAILKHTKRLLADVPETYRKLRVQFQTMPKEQRELFVALRDQYRENGKRVFDAFTERVERMKASPESKASAIQELRAQYDKMKKGIYFPLARFGDFVLIGTKEIDGIKTRVVEYYESEKAAGEAKQRMAKDGYQTKISKRKDAIADNGANKALAGVIEKVRELQVGGVAGKAELDLLLDGLNQSMIQMLPDQSYRRHFMHRKNTPGYSADFIRAYADSMWHSASHIAGLKHGDKVTASIEAMQNRIDREQTGDTSALQDVVNHLIYREERLREGTNKTVAFIGQAGFLSALASVSNFFVNLTQTPMLTLPHLGGRYGFGQASMQLLSGLSAQVRAMKTANTLTDLKHVMDIRNRLQGVEKDLMTRLHDMGKIDLTGSHDLIDAANRDAPRPDSAWDVAMRVAAFPQHASEVINRQVTALAAIRLELKKSGSMDDALNAAVEAIDQTHYDYEKSNRAMLMHGNTQRILFMFKQYAQKTAFLWARTAYLAVGGDNASPEVKKIARKQLAGMVAMQAALSGVLGLPIFLEAGVVASGVVGFKLGGKTGAYLGVAGAAILIAISAATDDDEDEFDAEVRRALSDMVGKEWGEVLARGAVRLTGVDISGRVNADELFIRKPDKSVEGKDARLAWMDAILGYAIGGQAANIYTGLSMMGDGYIYRGAEKIMPVKALRDLMQAVRLAKDGLTTMKGDKLVDDLNMGQIATKALGFQPAEVAEAYERNAAIKGAEAVLNDQRSKLLDKRWALKQDNDTDGMKSNWADIQEFNKKHPTHRILMQDVYKSFAARKRANQKQVGGITVSRKHKELRDKGSFANVD